MQSAETMPPCAPAQRGCCAVDGMSTHRYVSAARFTQPRNVTLEAVSPSRGMASCGRRLRSGRRRQVSLRGFRPARHRGRRSYEQARSVRVGSRAVDRRRDALRRVGRRLHGPRRTCPEGTRSRWDVSPLLRYRRVIDRCVGRASVRREDAGPAAVLVLRFLQQPSEHARIFMRRKSRLLAFAEIVVYEWSTPRVWLSRG